jgi:cell division protein DivIC
MRLFRHIPAWLRNKYFLAIAVFAVIMLFLDKNDFFSQLERRKELHALEKSRDYFQEEIRQLNLQRSDNKPYTLEKLSREKYLMKRDNEDLFVIEESNGEKSN